MIKEIIVIILNVCIISAFIGFFYFNYILKVEQQIVEEQIDIIVKDFTSDIIPLIPNSTLEMTSVYLDNYKLPDMSELDKQTIESNKKLYDVAKKFLLIIFIVGITLSILLWKFGKVSNKDMKTIIKEVIVTLLLVAFVEFFFTRYLVKNYISVNPNQIKLKILETIEKNL